MSSEGTKRPTLCTSFFGVVKRQCLNFVLDMALMTLCPHMIISPGTFSWWFSTETVIYMKDHPQPGSPLSKHPNFWEGFYLPAWIGMSNSWKCHLSRDARKTGLRGFRPGPAQTVLYIHKVWLEAWNFVFRKYM